MQVFPILPPMVIFLVGSVFHTGSLSYAWRLLISGQRQCVDWWWRRTDIANYCVSKWKYIRRSSCPHSSILFTSTISRNKKRRWRRIGLWGHVKSRHVRTQFGCWSWSKVRVIVSVAPENGIGTLLIIWTSRVVSWAPHCFYSGILWRICQCLIDE